MLPSLTAFQVCVPADQLDLLDVPLPAIDRVDSFPLRDMEVLPGKRHHHVFLRHVETLVTPVHVIVHALEAPVGVSKDFLLRERVDMLQAVEDEVPGLAFLDVVRAVDGMDIAAAVHGDDERRPRVPRRQRDVPQPGEQRDCRLGRVVGDTVTHPQVVQWPGSHAMILLYPKSRIIIRSQKAMAADIRTRAKSSC